MIMDAITDANDADEQLMGLYNMIEENLAVPFDTNLLGVAVTVTRIELITHGITATCVRGQHRQSIHLLDLPLPTPPPPGWERIAAYRQWAG